MATCSNYILSKMEQSLRSTNSCMEKTVSDLNLEPLISSEMTKNLQTFFEARTEDLRRTERSTGVSGTTIG